MTVAGIICEFNPLHSGHAYLMARLRQQGADAVVCAMSGNFVQRGEPALVNKLSRAEMAVACGADLVLELPTPWAMATAETFARGGVTLLAMAGCTHIGFGSECGDAAALQATADTLLSPDLQADIRAALADGVTYAAARQEAAAPAPGLSFRDTHGTLTEEQVKTETARCLGCGASVVDPNKCIGCGICTTKCEFDAIHLSRDLPECSTMVRTEDKFKAILPYMVKRGLRLKFGKKG